MAALAQLAARLIDCESWHDAARWADAAIAYLVPGSQVALMTWDPRSVAAVAPRENEQIVPIEVAGEVVGAIHCVVPVWHGHTLAYCRAVARLLGRFARAQAERCALCDRAQRDPLTNLLNRGYLRDRLPVELARGRRHARPVGLILVDVDSFKRFNTELGYAAGDAVLTRMARLLEKGVRSSDVVCRLGGDEFAIILWDASLDGAVRRARSLIDRVSASSYVDNPPLWPAVTATAGVAVAPMHADSAVTLLARADDALRAAKRAGRESLCVFGQPEPVQRGRDSVGTTLPLEVTWPALDEAG